MGFLSCCAGQQNERPHLHAQGSAAGLPELQISSSAVLNPLGDTPTDTVTSEAELFGKNQASRQKGYSLSHLAQQVYPENLAAAHGFKELFHCSTCRTYSQATH